MEGNIIDVPVIDDDMQVEKVEYVNPLNDKMTIFYRKANGEIKQLMSGACDMSVFLDEESDYTMIWNFIVIDYDETVRFNAKSFQVDLETKELIYTPLIDLSKYRMRYDGDE